MKSAAIGLAALASFIQLATVRPVRAEAFPAPVEQQISAPEDSTEGDDIDSGEVESGGVEIADREEAELFSDQFEEEDCSSEEVFVGADGEDAEIANQKELDEIVNKLALSLAKQKAFHQRLSQLIADQRSQIELGLRVLLGREQAQRWFELDQQYTSRAISKIDEALELVKTLQNSAGVPEFYETFLEAFDALYVDVTNWSRVRVQHFKGLEELHKVVDGVFRDITIDVVLLPVGGLVGKVVLKVGGKVLSRTCRAVCGTSKGGGTGVEAVAKLTTKTAECARPVSAITSQTLDAAAKVFKNTSSAEQSSALKQLWRFLYRNAERSAEDRATVVTTWFGSPVMQGLPGRVQMRAFGEFLGRLNFSELQQFGKIMGWTL